MDRLETDALRRPLINRISAGRINPLAGSLPLAERYKAVASSLMEVGDVLVAEPEPPMAKVLRIGAVVLVVGLAISWAYRLGTPTLTDQQVETIALQQAEHLGPGSVATQAVLYPADQVRSSTGNPRPYLRTSGCITRLPLPSFICPMRSIWVVRVHTPGRGNYDLFIDATTGQPAN
jgi:hypothetical protein